jgi:serine/threonine-protein kinase
MPDLRGLQLQAVRDRIKGLGMKVTTVDSMRHPTVARGLVFGQSPLPGQLAMPSTPVRVALSLGPQLRSVPDVRNLDAARARVVLETSGFVVTTDSAESDVPRGRVVDVTPPPDSVVPLPTSVTLTVSTGPPLVAMPLVLGMTEDDARSKLDSLGLVVSEVKQVFRFGRDQGIVVEQQPAAATQLEPQSG